MPLMNIYSKNRILYESASTVFIVCANMAFIATVLINVDLPEAFEPVRRTDFSTLILFFTGFAISG